MKLFCYGYSCFGTLYLFRPIHKIFYILNRIVSFVLYIYIN